jgi:hypothetical protein
VEIRNAFDDTPLAANARGAVHDATFVDSLRPYGSVGNGTLVAGLPLMSAQGITRLKWRARGTSRGKGRRKYVVTNATSRRCN